MSASESVPTPDDGVIARVRRRTATAAMVPMGVAAVLAVGGWAWPGWFVGVVGTVIGIVAVGVCVLAAAALLRRARLWAVAGRVAAGRTVDRGPADGEPAPQEPRVRWVRGVCGDATPARNPRAGPPLLRRARRYPPHLLPLRTVSGPLAAGEAVIVHARRDGALPAPADELTVATLGVHGPILIARAADGALFACDRWTFSAL